MMEDLDHIERRKIIRSVVACMPSGGGGSQHNIYQKLKAMWPKEAAYVDRTPSITVRLQEIAANELKEGE